MILKLTKFGDNSTIYVNISQAEHFEQQFMDGQETPGTKIVFRDPDAFIIVNESAEDIFASLDSDEEEEDEGEDNGN